MMCHHYGIKKKQVQTGINVILNVYFSKQVLSSSDRKKRQKVLGRSKKKSKSHRHFYQRQKRKRFQNDWNERTKWWNISANGFQKLNKYNNWKNGKMFHLKPKTVLVVIEDLDLIKKGSQEEISKNGSPSFQEIASIFVTSTVNIVQGDLFV